ADHPRFRWLGPHKGMVHLALASITNACFDLWAKSRGVPLWRLLLDISPEQVVNTLDLSYLEDVLTREDALAILAANQPERSQRQSVLQAGYPGYDTSIGWFNYSDEQIRENVKEAVANGFTAMKLKVGSADSERDIRRTYLVRQAAGDNATIMLDANQSWSLPKAIRVCLQLADMSPYWIEEPTHPDDVLAHQTLARAIAPIKVALGEHVPNRVMFKNFLQAQAASFVQVDATRVGGISEFITVSLLARKFGVSVVPHVGDMGQIHQHMVLFNHIALGHEAIFLEHIPHLSQHFLHPAVVTNGVYKIPQEPGSSSDFVE
ncbi:MAG: mandelate racemase, partial [Chloroflexi bacterium]